MKSLLQIIDEHDRAQLETINELLDENEKLRQERDDAIAQLASYVATVDKMKLDLIMAGALVKPKPEGDTT